MAHKINLDADIEFGEEIITIKHKNKQLTEVKDWNWINEILISKKMVFIVVYYPNRFLISIDKNKLSESELHFFAKKFSSLKNQ
ncbi:hypothetical protein [Chryseobacterium cucumeris]|uniref:hypothetical protein n=1 Tax=Chryseobacterium cucumeris TaxID=1813611 RepID=UPI003D95B997